MGTNGQPERPVALPSRLHRRYHSRLEYVAGPIGAVALANIVLLFVLFALARSAFVVQPGVLVSLPAADFRDGRPYGSLVVTLSGEGALFFNDEQTTLQALPAALARAAREHGDEALIVEADNRVPHGTIVDVYNMAVAAGLRNVLLATRLPPAAEAVP